MKKKYIIVAPYKTFNWLLAPIINILKKKYDYHTIFIIPKHYKLPKLFLNKLSKSDKFYYY